MITLIQNQPGTLSLELRNREGALQNSSTVVNVVVTNPLGTIIATGNALNVAVGKYEFSLTPSQTATLDEFDVSWSTTLGGASVPFVTRYQTAGGYYFSVQEAREFDKKQLGDVQKYGYDAIARMREEVEEDIEDECGVAFVRRGKRETLLNDYDDLILSRREVRALYSAMLDGTALTLSEIDVKPEGALERVSGFNGEVTVYYEHGYELPPAPVKRAALTLLVSRLVPSNIDKRVISHTDESGTRQYAVPGRDGPFGIPEVDSIVKRFRDDDPGIG